MKKYRFLLFDLDHTLLDFNADEAMAFQKLYALWDLGKIRPYSPEMLALYDRCNGRWWRAFEDGKCSKSQLFVGRFADFLEEAGLEGDPERMNSDYFEFLGTGGVAFPGVLEMLERLSADHLIYVITNGNSGTAKTRIENSGIKRYIRDYFVSEAIGYAKPDVRYFEYVCAGIPGFRKEEALVIGDSPLTDIRGAANAGLDSLWYRSDGWWDGRGVPCTYQASSYEEIERILRG